MEKELIRYKNKKFKVEKELGGYKIRNLRWRRSLEDIQIIPIIPNIPNIPNIPIIPNIPNIPIIPIIK